MKQWKRALALALSLCLVLALPLRAGAANETVEHAYDLNDLGLFQGTDSGFELDKRPTRVEGMTMFVRLLGGEREAKDNNYAHPFTDVPKWGDPYVGYAWEKGLTKGTGKGLFGSTAYITLEEYVTFVLRALGYDDSQGDFTWKTSVDKAVEIGLLTREQANGFLGEATSRGTMVDVSYAALTQTFKGSERTLAEKLVGEGVFTRELAIQKGVWTAQSPAPSATPETSPKPTQTPKPTDSPRPTESPKPSERPEPVKENIYGFVIGKVNVTYGSNSKKGTEFTVWNGEESDTVLVEGTSAVVKGAYVEYTVSDNAISSTEFVALSPSIVKVKEHDVARKLVITTTETYGVNGVIAGTDTFYRMNDDTVVIGVKVDGNKSSTNNTIQKYTQISGSDFNNAALVLGTGTEADLIKAIYVDEDNKINSEGAFVPEDNSSGGTVVYGIVTAEDGRRKIGEDVYYSYTVASNGDEYTVCLPDEALERGMLVSFAEAPDSIYTVDDITVYTEKNALASWVKEYDERSGYLCVYTDIALEDSGSYYEGQEMRAYVVSKDCAIISVDAYNKKSECDVGVWAFDQVTGYKNAAVVVDEDNIVVAIFMEISNECDILP